MHGYVYCWGKPSYYYTPSDMRSISFVLFGLTDCIIYTRKLTGPLPREKVKYFKKILLLICINC